MQNFGKIKHTFNSLLAESLTTNDSATKSMFKEYVKAVKGSEILRTQFNVYYNIENKHDNDSFKSSEYIKENIGLINKFGGLEIVKENEKLINILKKYNHELFENTYPNLDLHENISTLVFTKKNSKNIDTVIESLNHIVEHVKNNEIVLVESREIFPNSILSSILVEKFNEKYESLGSDYQKIIKNVLNSNEEEKTNMFEDLKRDCLELINEKVKITEDSDSKNKLLDVKSAIIDMKYNQDSYVSDISRVIELKEDLTNE